MLTSAPLERAMRKLLVISSALAIVTAFAAAPAEAASGKSAQARAEKREQCTTEARGATGLDRGRGFRTRFRACMVRQQTPDVRLAEPAGPRWRAAFLAPPPETSGAQPIRPNSLETSDSTLPTFSNFPFDTTRIAGRALRSRLLFRRVWRPMRSPRCGILVPGAPPNHRKS